MEQEGLDMPLVRAAMRADVLPAHEGDPVIDVARALVAAGASSAPVIGADGALVGIVSEYDLLSKPGATAGAVMSRGVISIGPDATAADATRLMGLHGIHVLPVVERSELLGVVTRSDLLRVYAATQWRCGACGELVFGLAPPDACPACGGHAYERSDAV